MSAVLMGPADPDNYRRKVGRYGDRWYCDPLPADQIAPASPADEAWPSVSTIKKASGSDWSFVALKRVATAVESHQYARLDLMPWDHRYEALKAINKLGLSAAGDRGTNVHLMAEARLRGRVAMIPNGAPGLEYRAAVDQFFDAYQPTLVAAEFVVINRTLGYGGTADAIVDIEGKRYLVDWKSRGDDSDHGAYPEEAAQLGAYAAGDYVIVDVDGHARRLPPFEVDGGLIVSIKPNGVRVYPIDLHLGFEHFVAMHAWWTARRTEKAAIGRQWAGKVAAAANVGAVAVVEAAGSVSAVVPADAAGPPPFDEPAPLAPSAPAPARLRFSPDEGGDASAAAVDALRQAYQRTYGMQRQWINRCSLEARQAGTSFLLSERATVRRFEITRGIVALSKYGENNDAVTDLDEIARAICLSILGDAALTARTLGALIGSFDATDATTFAARVDLFTTSTIPGVIDEHGNLRLQFAA